ncbi:hypothetical protein [Nocardia panacis]|uniref:hypothetical protein n=1 Tax=Nocardia panacis TaxID=2340916 RepID=UPI0013159FE4|nr:hypothetical protein [Nocardia panacis]
MGVVVGRPFPSVEALLPSYLQQRHQISVGPDRGLIGSNSSGDGRTLALQHGNVQLLVTNLVLGEIPGKKLDDAGMAAVAREVVGKLPQAIPDAPRDVPAICDQVRGVPTIIGPVTFARGRSEAGATSCDFVGETKHLLLTVSFTKMDSASVARFKTDNGPARLSLIPDPLFPGTLSRGYRDGSGLALETMVDERILVYTKYKTLCYDDCHKYGVVNPGKAIGPDDSTLIASSIDLARTMK